jgi:hypothetical protein
MQTSLKKLGLIFGLWMVVSFFWGCSKNENAVDNGQIVGSGRIVTESRSCGTFTGIQVTNFAKVFITQDTVESLRIESDDNIIGSVQTTLNGAILVVGLRDGSYGHVTVNVYASMKNIKFLESIGTADFSAVNSIQTDSLICKITGTGNVTLAGKTNYEKVQITGSGNIQNSNLLSSFCTITISGTGNVQVHVTQQLDATIAGTGNITYDGNPALIHQSITGVGVVRPGH